MKKKKEKFQSLKSKIKSPRSLKQVIQKLKKARGRSFKIVFTNGCFDLLHKGHVHYLEQAKRLGQILVVALNSDQSVRKLKGPTRPLNTLADRLEVIAALASVDYATWFDSDTPLEVIQLLQPDILVKGGDWKVEQIVGSKEVLSRGGKVFSLKYIEGRSTTSIINNIKKARNS